MMLFPSSQFSRFARSRTSYRRTYLLSLKVGLPRRKSRTKSKTYRERLPTKGQRLRVTSRRTTFGTFANQPAYLRIRAYNWKQHGEKSRGRPEPEEKWQPVHEGMAWSELSRTYGRYRSPR